MIEANGLTKQFERFLAVNALSLHVAAGELLALLGPNGAGKTTTVRMLSAILKPTSGTALINGHDVVAAPEKVRRAIGLLTEQPGLYLRMTGLDYLAFYGRLYNVPPDVTRRRSQAMFERFGMGDAGSRRLGQYSKGMRQKVGLIRALLHDPAVLLLDEPTSAMDPHSAKLVRDAIAEMRDDRRAVIICTHNLAEAELVADRIAIIKRGRLVASGTPAELKSQLLGVRLFEVTVDPADETALAAAATGLASLVAVESIDALTLRYRTATPWQDNPAVARYLVGLGMGIVTMAEVSQSLESVYLHVVAGKTAVRSNGEHDDAA